MLARSLRNIAILFTFLVNAAPLSAATIALTFSSQTVTGSPVGNFGWTFDTSQALTIGALGAYGVINGSPGDVGLWDSSGTLLAEATVTSTDVLIDGFNFNAITPISLPAATDYTIAVIYPVAGGPFGFIATNLTTAPGITYTGGAVQFGTSLARPVGDDLFNHDFDPGYFGPNFVIDTLDTAVPEPAYQLLLGLASFGILFFKRQ